MEKEKNDIYELIDSLRLPMIIGIVYIHTHFFKYLSQEVLNQLPITENIIYICSVLVGGVFTPTFFFISGYLFFRRGTLNKEIYFEKLQHRFHSLLIPYVIWNLLMLGVMFLQEKMMGSASTRMGTLSEYSALDVLYAFFDSTQSWSFVGEIGQPANVSLWFLRDLMIMVVFSPFFYALVKKKWIALCVLFAIYCCPYHFPHLHNLSIFWFGMGSWMQINKIDFVILSRKVVMICISIFCISIIAHEYNDIQFPFDIIMPIMRISEFLLLIAIASFVKEHNSKQIPQRIRSSSFFIYMSHIVPTSTLCLLACHLLPLNDLYFSVAYLLIPIIVTIILICIYLLLKYYMPRITDVLTGNR